MNENYIFARSLILNECADIMECQVYSDSTIRIATMPTFDNDICMFKVYKTTNDNNFIGISRISMLEPKYIDSEYPNYLLSKKDIQTIIKALSCQGEFIPYRYTIETFPKTAWELMIKELNHEYSREQNHELVPDNLPMPDYSLLPTRD